MSRQIMDCALCEITEEPLHFTKAKVNPNFFIFLSSSLLVTIKVFQRKYSGRVPFDLYIYIPATHKNSHNNAQVGKICKKRKGKNIKADDIYI